MCSCHCCYIPAEQDPDYFDAGPWLRPRPERPRALSAAGRAAARLEALLRAVPPANARAAVRCDARPGDAAGVAGTVTGIPQGRLPGEEPRNIVAQGMKRFEIDKVAPPQPDWERLSPAVVSVLGQNPGHFTLNGTNLYIVGTGRRRVLIDAGEAPVPRDFGYRRMIPVLRRVLGEIGCEGFSHILVTHLHGDHFGGTEALLAEFPGPTLVGMIPLQPHSLGPYTVQQCRERGLAPAIEAGPCPFDDKGRWQPEFYRHPERLLPFPNEDLSWDWAARTKLELVNDYWYMKRHVEWYARWSEQMPSQVLRDGDVIRAEGATLHVMHTPGHADNHAMFFFEEERAIFSGDHVLGYGTTVMIDLLDYMASLRRALALAPGRLYPGHGPLIEDGSGLLERYTAHRQEREDQVVHFLERAGEPHSLDGITAALYTETPEERQPQARENITKILMKLFREDRAVCLDDEGGAVQLPQRGNIRRLRRDWLWRLK